MNNIRKFYLAAKNAQREFSKHPKSYLSPSYYSHLEKELNKLGFHGSHNFSRFINYFRTIPAKRRQSIMRIGRAALKRNTFVGLSDFYPRGRWEFDGNGGFRLRQETEEKDLRKILFLEDIIKEREKKECIKYVKLLKSMIPNEEIIKLVLGDELK